MRFRVLTMLLMVLVMLLASGAGNALREASSSAVALRSLLHVGVCLQAACHIISSFKPHGAYFEFSSPGFSVLHLSLVATQSDGGTD